MPGRFGVLCMATESHEGPFEEGPNCVTLVPRPEHLAAWAKSIVDDWDKDRGEYSWTPYGSVVVRYFDAAVSPKPLGGIYFHRAGHDGIYDLCATRQLGQFTALTMQDLFNDFARNELPPNIKLDGRLPSLADHLAIQCWVYREFSIQLADAFMEAGLETSQARSAEALFCSGELERNNERMDRRNEEEQTIEGYEMVCVSTEILRRKFPRLPIHEIKAFLLSWGQYGSSESSEFSSGSIALGGYEWEVSDSSSE